MRKIFLGLTAVVLFSLSPKAARGEPVVFFTDAVAFNSALNTSPGVGPHEDVLFNLPTLRSTGPFVEGTVPRFVDGSRHLSFHNVSGQPLSTQSPGPPRIIALQGSLTEITVQSIGHDGSAYRAFSLIVTPQDGAVGTVTVTLDIGKFPEEITRVPFEFSVTGPTFFGFILEKRSSAFIRFSTDFVIKDLRQIRVSDFGPTEPVPEPATLLLLGTGLAGVGLKRLRRRHLT